MLSKEGQVHNEKLAIITEEIILPENACSLILKNKLLAYSNVWRTISFIVYLVNFVYRTLNIVWVCDLGLRVYDSSLVYEVNR